MRKTIIFLFTSFCMILFLTSCDDQEVNPAKKSEMASDQHPSSAEHNDVEMTLWAFYDGGWEYHIRDFQKIYPNVQIKVEAFSYDEYSEKFLHALVTGHTPDMMVFNSAHFNNFKDIDGLLDMSKAPYHADEFKKDLPPSLWQLGKSIDNQKVIGIPLNTGPLVTYYRKDIMEQYGFPSDPEELASYMEDPNHWMTMAETFIKDGRNIVQKPGDLIYIYQSGTSLLNKSIEFNRNNETFEHALRMSQEAYQKDLFTTYDIYMPEGQEALKNDQIAMLYLGTHGTDFLNSLVPEQAGKWRVTRLPFNVHGWEGSNIMAIPEASNHKELAWEFIKLQLLSQMKQGYHGSVPAYLPARYNPNNYTYEPEFLGGQEIQSLYESIMAQTEEHFTTPLDQRAEKIWNDRIYGGIQWNIDAKEVLNQIEGEISAQLGREQEILKSVNTNQ